MFKTEAARHNEVDGAARLFHREQLRRRRAVMFGQQAGGLRRQAALGRRGRRAQPSCSTGLAASALPASRHTGGQTVRPVDPHQPAAAGGPTSSSAASGSSSSGRSSRSRSAGAPTCNPARHSRRWRLPIPPFSARRDACEQAIGRRGGGLVKQPGLLLPQAPPPSRRRTSSLRKGSTRSPPGPALRPARTAPALRKHRGMSSSAGSPVDCRFRRISPVISAAFKSGRLPGR